MSKQALIDHVAASAGLSGKQATAAVNAMIEGIPKLAETGLQLRGLGTFRYIDQAPRIGRNPQTGEPLQIPARRVLKFKAS